jgi:DNA-binding IclR family transcriptional regulator
MPRAAVSPAPVTWTFLSNHAHVLIHISRTPDARMRDVAQVVGITERAVQRIVAELVAGGFLVVAKDGRRNHYAVNDRLPLRHPVEAHRTIRDLLALVR